MIIWDQRERCGDWALARIPNAPASWGEWYQAIGLEKDGELMAVVVFNYFSKADISMNVAAVPGSRWMTKAFLKAVFAYPFVQLGVRRITGLVATRNVPALRFDEHIGFKREGLIRHGTVDDDLVVMGMLKEECRWL
jgi:RimJ/RimL family protein N-acetyltransferase